MDMEKLMKAQKAAPAAAKVQLDKSVCTVVGALPFRLYEQKPGLFPISLFTLPPVKKTGDVNTLVVREGFYFRYVGDGKQIEQYEKAEVIARSVVNDYCNSQLGIDSTNEEPEKNAKPALFFVYGEWTSSDIKEYFADELELALIQQVNWFKRLVALADDDWNKYHQHKMISDLQRFAAQTLGYKSEWTNISTIATQPDICPACKSMIPGGALICQICRTIVNQKEYDKLGLKQAV